MARRRNLVNAYLDEASAAARDEVASLDGARHLDRTVSARHAGL